MSVTFDKVRRLIIEDDSGLDINTIRWDGIYSWWKEWVQLGTNSQYPIAFRAVAGDPISETKELGATLFLLNGWALKPAEYSHTLNLIGNVYTDPSGRSTSVPTDGSYTVLVSTDVSVLAESSVQQLEAIEYGEFGGGVTLNVLEGFEGTGTAPNGANIGTPRAPSDNLADTMLIADGRGFTTIFVVGDAIIDSGGDYKEMIFVGASKTKSTLDVSEAAEVDECEFYDCHVTGTLDGDSTLKDCLIDDLNYVTGYIEQCVLDAGTILLGQGATAHFLDCWSGVPGTGTPTVDCGGSGQSLAMRNYNGGIKLINKSGTESISLDLNSGQVKIDLTTVIRGTIVIRGIGKVIEATTGEHIQTGAYGDLYILNEAISRDIISAAIWDEQIEDHIVAGTTGHQMYHDAYADTVHIDTINGEAGTDQLIGTAARPSNNITDTLYILQSHHFSKIHVVGDLTLVSGDDVSGVTIGADRSLGNSITVEAGVITDITYFEDITVSGTMNGPTRFTTCVLGEIINLDGGAKNCLITSRITVAGTGSNYLTECDVYVTDFTFKEVDIGDKSLNIIRSRGLLEITNYTGTDAVTIDMVSGYVKVAPTCVSGMITISGLTQIMDLSGAGCIVQDSTLTRTGVVDAVLNTVTS